MALLRHTVFSLPSHSLSLSLSFLVFFSSFFFSFASIFYVHPFEPAIFFHLIVLLLFSAFSSSLPSHLSHTDFYLSSLPFHHQPFPMLLHFLFFFFFFFLSYTCFSSSPNISSFFRYAHFLSLSALAFHLFFCYRGRSEPSFFGKAFSRVTPSPTRDPLIKMATSGGQPVRHKESLRVLTLTTTYTTHGAFKEALFLTFDVFSIPLLFSFIL